MPEAEAENVPRTDPFDLAWRFFSSVRLALILILVLAGASLAGALISQAPAGVTDFQEEYAMWLTGARGRFGGLTDIMSALQLFSIFNSIWFKALVGLLSFNLFVCTVGRWPAVWRTISHPRVRMAPTFFRNVSNNLQLRLGARPADEATQTLAGFFRGKRYRVITEQDGDVTHLYADRNRFGGLGTFVHHSAILLVLVGVLVGGRWGFAADDFTIAEGSRRDVGHGSNLTVYAESFADEYFDTGQPKDYWTSAVLYENGVEVMRHDIRVNDPMIYKGYRFHQAYFGPAAVMEVKDKSGRVIFSDGVPLPYSNSVGGVSRPYGSISLSTPGQSVYIIGPTSETQDTMIQPGQVRVEIVNNSTFGLVAGDVVTQGQAKTIGDFEFTFVRERQFTGLRVVNDPGVNIIWVACVLLVAGVAMVFYFPHRRIWAQVQRDKSGAVTLLAAGTAARDPGFAGEFARVRAEVEELFQAKSAAPQARSKH